MLREEEEGDNQNEQAWEWDGEEEGKGEDDWVSIGEVAESTQWRCAHPRSGGYRERQLLARSISLF